MASGGRAQKTHGHQCGAVEHRRLGGLCLPANYCCRGGGFAHAQHALQQFRVEHLLLELELQVESAAPPLSY
jgi:hypothetical protein